MGIRALFAKGRSADRHRRGMQASPWLRSLLVGVLCLAAGSAGASVIDVSVQGLLSFDPLGDPDNQVLVIDLGDWLGTSAPIQLDGLGWNVGIATEAGSWLSEAHIAFQDSATTLLYDFAPGAADTWYGAAFYDSGGIVSLGAGGQGFTLGDGILRLEFFETYNDYQPQPEAIWFGSLHIRAAAVPLPPSFIFLGSGLTLYAGLWFMRERQVRDTKT